MVETITRYISDFDELHWYINVDQYAFYECRLHWGQRFEFAKWLRANCNSTVYCWNGLVNPSGSPAANDGWGKLISPDGETFFLIFLNSADEEIFVLRYSGSEILRKCHKNGTAAYHSQRGQ